MGHGKETPRQKMIGLMYLFLTAMLALNVSKDVLNSFLQVSESMEQTITNYLTKNEKVYNAFEKEYMQNPDKVGEWKDKADRVKIEATKLFEILEGHKVGLLQYAEPSNVEALVDGKVIYANIKAKDNIDKGGEYFMYGEGKPGRSIKEAINVYREALLEIIPEEEVNIRAGIEGTLDTHDHPGKEGEAPHAWESYTFEHIPLIADFVVLSTLQANVKNSETDVINYLYSQISAGDFKVNKIEATVTSKSNYIMRGGDYQAQVFVAAYDSTQDPEIYIGEFKEIAPGKYEVPESAEKLEVVNGKGVYSVPTRSTGVKSWGGLIKLKNPDGGESFYPFESEYQVAEPNLVISPTKMNVLYYGIENPVAISVPGIPSDKIRPSISSGARIKKVRKGYEITPTKTSGKVNIRVSAEIDGKSKSMGSMEFRIKTIPEPKAKVLGRNSGTLTKAMLAAAPGVIAELEDFVFDLKFRVTKFTLTATVGGYTKEFNQTGNKFTKEQKDFIKSLKSNSKIIIENIEAVGPDGRTKPLSPIVLKVK